MCNFHQHLLKSFLVLFIALCTAAHPNHHLRISSAGVDLLSPTSAGIRFFALLNNTSNSENFQVDLVPEKCCLDTVNKRQDCRSMELVGLHLDSIPAETVLNVKLVAPVLNPLNRKGYCSVNLDSKNVNRYGKAMREPFRIYFDTFLENLDDELFELVDAVAKCNNTDEDPLSNCGPVDCDVHYNGQKSFFNRKLRQCVRVPQCLPNTHMDHEIIYNPHTNRCQTTLMVEKEDLEFIKSLQDNNTPLRSITDLLQVETPDPSQECAPQIKDVHCPWALAGNKNIAILGSIVLLQFFALVFVCCRYTKTCRSGKGQKQDKAKSVFHCQQNVSDTTPLIGSSNTQTTDFINESLDSNPALVKSYKSIQKEFNDDHIEKAPSDDILTKCLNRRIWKPSSRTESIPEKCSTKTIEDLVEKPNDFSCGSSNLYRSQCQQCAKSQISYVTETTAKNVMIYDDDEEYHDITRGQESEEEIKCHSYSADKSSTLTEEESGEKTKFVQNSAQIDFSPDAIDQYLENKNIYMLPMELSRYSFPDTKTTGNSFMSL